MRFSAFCFLLLTITANGDGPEKSMNEEEGSGDVDNNGFYPELNPVGAGFGFAVIAAIARMKIGNNSIQAPTNGKLRHDMRTFVNITFDWSSRAYDQEGLVVIPQCHEHRLRKSYYQYQLSAMANGRAAFTGVRTGHLVYPFVVTVVNETSPEPLTVYYAVGVHKLFTQRETDYAAMLSYNGTLVDIVNVSKKTWNIVWDRWTVALNKGKKLCDGGPHFDKLIPRINIEKQKLKPQYDDIVQKHTESTTDACGVASCGCPRNQTETLTFAFPTEEGMEELRRTNSFGTIDTLSNETFIPILTQGQTMHRMISFLESCYKSEHEKEVEAKMLFASCYFLVLLVNSINGKEGSRTSTKEAEENGAIEEEFIDGEEDGSNDPVGLLKTWNSLGDRVKSKLLIHRAGGTTNHEVPTNGKLIHDMRTFINITFDWSSQAFKQQGVVIPQCHEYRLRKSFYKHQMPALVNWESASKGVRSGHLVYPFVVTLHNDNAPNDDKVYYAAGVHQLFANRKYDFEALNNSTETFIDLVFVSYKTWRVIWNRWTIELSNGLRTLLFSNNLCHGGRQFDYIIPRINIDRATLKPQYNDIIGYHTESFTDVCGVTSCECPRDQTETLTFATPTEEGLEQMMQHGNMTVLTKRSISVNRLIGFLDSCYEGDFLKGVRKTMRDNPILKSESSEIGEIRCIFYPPYC